MIYLIIFLFLNAKILNKVVATVDGEPIFLSELNSRARPIIEEYSKIVNPEELKKKEKDIKEEILNQMIEEKLLLQEAKRKGIRVSEREVDEGIAEIKSRFKSEKEYQEELKRQGLTPSKMRENIREQLMIIKLIDMEVKSKIENPTDKELEEFYKNNKEMMWEPEKVRVRHIFIKVSSTTPKEVARKKAIKILKLAKEGEDFSELARKYSDAPSKVNGGDLGFFARGEMTPEFEKVAFSLNVGEISDIVETENGFHIIKCIGKKAREKRSFEDVKEDLRSYIFRLRFEDSYNKYIRRLRDKAVIKINEDAIE
ncbi:MAG: hypothetical protein DRI36_06060 [Caldiserica bacterium]|nr:MAG: hypothetical protein DRI36_06060 [Caldisericota bacterium]